MGYTTMAAVHDGQSLPFYSHSLLYRELTYILLRSLALSRRHLPRTRVASEISYAYEDLALQGNDCGLVPVAQFRAEVAEARLGRDADMSYSG